MEPINNTLNSYIETDLITKLNLNNNYIASGVTPDVDKTPQKIIISDDVEIEINNGTYTGRDIRELLELKSKLKSLYPELFLI